MEKTVLNVKECLHFGWNTFIARPWFFVSTVIIYMVIQIIVGVLQESLPGIVTFLLSLVVSTLLYVGLINVYLKAHDNVESPQLKDLWNPSVFWSYLGLSILLFIIVGIGFVLLIIPGIFLAIALGLSGFALVDRKLNPIEALKESWRLTKGSRWKLVLLSLALLVIAILGIIPLMLGLLVAVPVAMLASTHAYRTLSGGTLTTVEKSEPVTTPDVA